MPGQHGSVRVDHAQRVDKVVETVDKRVRLQDELGVVERWISAQNDLGYVDTSACVHTVNEPQFCIGERGVAIERRNADQAEQVADLVSEWLCVERHA